MKLLTCFVLLISSNRSSLPPACYCNAFVTIFTVSLQLRNDALLNLQEERLRREEYFSHS